MERDNEIASHERADQRLTQFSALTGGLTLYSRNDRDISRSYPEIAALEIGQGLIVDGELVALDQRGPDFGLLRQRIHITQARVEVRTWLR